PTPRVTRSMSPSTAADVRLVGFSAPERTRARCPQSARSAKRLTVAFARLFAGAINEDSAVASRAVVSAAGLAPISGEVVTEFQSDSARTDSAVRVLYAQPGSQLSSLAT